ncbi:MAG TPA: NAD-dependent epimerase/dehydratase family protein [Thermoanaerobaculia bacterium]|nr:NAD-dependent epimerase/dehydratase family protein [Thermoanaerobaculia bacterium]HUM29812.1 NAD-dependent epimerase/dehydratase family protein [Thermoanaerobaculia bacterium]HXK68087.1 NAD-dependent epimerase/dehydratase family protein [Thermoanaerobaculia bacterium]
MEHDSTIEMETGTQEIRHSGGATVSIEGRLLITGATGFAGRHIVDALRQDWDISAFGRRHPSQIDVPISREIKYFQADISDEEPLVNAFREAAEGGTIDTVLHMAAYYDFKQDENPAYQSTNVTGTRNVLNAAKQIGVRRFIFISSLAACDYPEADQSLDESSPPDGKHIYARTKAMGERMLPEYRDHFDSMIIRFPAIFSDWCDYPPLYHFMTTWLSGRWASRIMAGRGESAIPFLHMRDLVRFIRLLLQKREIIPPGSVLIPSWDGAVTHRELYESSTRAYYGQVVPPRHMPIPLCRLGISLRYHLYRAFHRLPFECPWMAGHIDRQLWINASRTRHLLGWEPSPRLQVLRRIPFIVENMRSDPLEWTQRNYAFLHKDRSAVNLKIHHRLRTLETKILTRIAADVLQGHGNIILSHYRSMNPDTMIWEGKMLLHSLMNSIVSDRRSVFMDHCADMAEKRFAEEVPAEEVVEALSRFGHSVMDVLEDDPPLSRHRDELRRYIETTVAFGKDRVHEVYECRALFP